MTAIPQLAAQQGMQATELDQGVWMLEAMDDTGDYMEAQELNKALEAGQVQAHISGRV